MNKDKNVANLRKQANEGNLAPNEAITKLDETGVSITETMKFLVSEYGMALNEAKKLVSEHSSWSGLVKESQSAHDEILNKLTSSSNKKR